jgi:Fe2+ transport system protein B
MKQEMASWRWFLASFAFMVIVSFLAGTIAYHLALVAGLK